ncbi:fluoride efflux transporter FluC [Paucilactobacillus kaifaensis]|uniref:fluoride efflux transporter FluC n=1 Tax=Paucilactobacillus kaifaensis TaxID=2559921 RepID=UPI0010F87917|nr:CrcB family protein [Paucilactobacillus kaifaensis]
MRKYLAVLIFGALGGICRSLISQILVLPNQFPLGTLLVNLSGCFLFSLVVHYLALAFPLSPTIISGLSVGFVGAFTTFSGLSVDALKLIAHQQYSLFILYDLTSIIGGIILALLGIMISKQLFKRWEQW